MHIFQVGLTLISSCVEMVSLWIFTYSLGYLLRLPPPHSPIEIWGSKTLPPIVPTTQHSQQVGPTLAHIAEASMKTYIPKIYFLCGVRLT